MKCVHCDYEYMHELLYKYSGLECDKNTWMDGRKGGFYMHPENMVQQGAYPATRNLFGCPSCYKVFIGDL
jgi:hypothetical protein